MKLLSKPLLLKLYFLMGALESAVVFYLLISIPSDLKNIVFFGSEDALVFIQMNLPPLYFPNASDVFIIGCREDAGIRALAIKVNIQTSFITTSPLQGLNCLTQ